MDTHRVEYDLTLDDHLGFQMHVAERSPTIRRLRLLWIVFCCVVFASGASVMVLADLLWAAALIGALCVGYLPFYRADCRRSTRGRMKRMLAERGDPGTGRAVVEIGPDGLRSELAGAEARYPWSAIKHIERSGGATYVFVSSVMAVIIPDRAFAGAQEREAFVAAIESAAGR
jgi:hypothetical protein